MSDEIAQVSAEAELQTKEVPTHERIAYAQAMAGQNMIYTYFSTFLSMFYTDILHLSPAATGTLFLIARIWDAINDPMMGSLADRTRSRWGKMRPYLIIFSLPIGVISVLCFTGHLIPSKYYLLYAYVTYIAWGMLYTICDIPLWALSSMISTRKLERTQVLSWINVCATIGAGAILVFGIYVLGLFGGSEAPNAYYLGALVICGGGALMMFIGSFFVKERVVSKKEKASFLKNFSVIYKNPPLMILLSSMLIANFATNTRTAVQLYYVKYVWDNEGLMMVVAGIAVGAMLIGIIMAPMLTKKFSNKFLYIVTTAMAGVFHLLSFISGKNNVVFVVGFLALGCVFSGINSINLTNLLIDTIGYANKKLGIEGEGMAFSVKTLVVKLSTAIASWSTLAILGFVKYVPNVPQTDSVQQWMHAIMFLVPAIGFVLAMLPIFKFNTDSK